LEAAVDAIQNRLRELIVRHCGSLRTNSELLAGFISEMSEPGNTSGQPARDALHLAHQIAGAGGSIGFSEVSVLASDIEHALQPIVAVNGTPSPAQRERIDGLVRQLRSAADKLTPEGSNLYRVEGSALAPARKSA
jgi:HPt (histidine-containing phosphotransfer) domain-containing protein